VIAPLNRSILLLFSWNSQFWPIYTMFRSVFYLDSHLFTSRIERWEDCPLGQIPFEKGLNLSSEIGCECGEIWERADRWWFKISRRVGREKWRKQWTKDHGRPSNCETHLNKTRIHVRQGTITRGLTTDFLNNSSEIFFVWCTLSSISALTGHEMVIRLINYQK
jgi:hypothetical protein